jgi:flavin reductase (DIM6/NTAB) family NADH-FMN oxidoreductase RutF
MQRPSPAWKCPRGSVMPTPAERPLRPVISERRFRNALAQFATGVTIVTVRGPHRVFVGFTANSFNSVSLDPPLIIWSLARRSRSLAIFEGAERYAVNVLAHDQVELARRFSRPHTDRFAGVAHREGRGGVPLIEGCAAWIECRHHALHPAGDHMLFIGEVDHCAHRRVAPLLWHAGRYRGSPEARRHGH